MSRPDSPQDRPNRTGGAALLALGILILATSGLCSGGMLMSGGREGVVVVLIFGAPFLLLGLGLITLGHRHRLAGPGPAPGWHKVVGWLMLALCATGLGVLVVGGGSIALALWARDDARVLLQILPLMLFWVGLCLIPGLIGRTLLRPLR